MTTTTGLPADSGAPLPDLAAAGPAPSTGGSGTPVGPPGTTTRRPRLYGVDLARGLAILGMFGAHTLWTDSIGWNPATWADVVNGRSSILFATLAGVSLALMSGGARPYDGAALRDARTRILVRAALIFALGAVLSAFGSVAVILEVYAVLLVLALPFLRCSPRRLFLAAAVAAVVGPMARLLLADGLMAVDAYPTGFLEIMLTSTYPGLVWIAFVLLGLGVGRLDLTSTAVRGRLVAAGALLAVLGYTGGWATAQAVGVEDPWGGSSSLVEGSSSGSWVEPGSGDVGWDDSPEGVPGESLDLTGSTCFPEGDGFVYCEPSDWSEEDWEDGWDTGDGAAFHPDLTFLAGASPHSGTTFEVVGSSGVALSVLGLCLLAPRLVRRLLYPVAAAGSMALTLYSLHVVALRAAGGWAGEHPTLAFLALAVGALVLAVAWKAWRPQGPLEQVVSSVSRRAATATVRQARAAAAMAPASSAGRENIGQ